jgi:hypothetical protein
MKLQRRSGWLTALAMAGLALITTAMGAPEARAEFFVASGSGGDGAVSATANFVESAGKLTITLTNTLAASEFRSAGQALSDIQFTLSNAPGTLGTMSASGQLGDIGGKDTTLGLVTYTTTGGTVARWLGAGGQGGFNISGSTITLETIGGGKPNVMIAPFIADGGIYTNANNGLQQFNPYVIGPATFTLNLSGVTAATTVTSATFSFGTGPDTFVPGTQVPELSTLALAGLGALGFIGYGLRRRRQK